MKNTALALNATPRRWEAPHTTCTDIRCRQRRWNWLKNAMPFYLVQSADQNGKQSSEKCGPNVLYWVFEKRLRPAILLPQLVDASTLKPEVVAGLDIMIIRELTGGIYFGQPRGLEERDGERMGFNTLTYKESEIRRIGHVAFQTAMQRDKRVCSVDKANVLEVSELWREIMISVGQGYPEVELSHMYIDNACMQLVRAPKQFDVLVTTNLFGDILSDAASMLTGSIGMLPSASLDQHGKGMYEPVHGSAPDIAGQGIANPLATILSVAMMMRSTFKLDDLAASIENAVALTLESGLRTADIAAAGQQACSTEEMGDAVISKL